MSRCIQHPSVPNYLLNPIGIVLMYNFFFSLYFNFILNLVVSIDFCFEIIFRDFFCKVLFSSKGKGMILSLIPT